MQDQSQTGELTPSPGSGIDRVIHPARDKRVIDNELISSRTSTAYIYRQTFRSGETCVLKRAKSAQLNDQLRNEYEVLRKISGTMPMTDVSQATQVIKQILLGATDIPPSIDTWIRNVDANVYKSPEDAWKGLNQATFAYEISLK